MKKKKSQDLCSSFCIQPFQAHLILQHVSIQVGNHSCMSEQHSGVSLWRIMTPWPPLYKQDHFFQDTICSATCAILLLKTDLEDHLSLKERLLHLLDHTSLAFIQVLLHRDLLHVHSVRLYQSLIYNHLKKNKIKKTLLPERNISGSDCKSTKAVVE